jgi:hypothetical protein
MKRIHRLELEKVPGYVHDSGTLKLRIKEAERIGRDYEQIERLAYPERDAAAQADAFSRIAESQNQMLAKLKPMVEGIMNDPKDPRSQMMQQLLGMLGGLPPMHDVSAIHADIANSDVSAAPTSRDLGIDVEVRDEGPTPTESAEWLSHNFNRLVPGLVEAAKYAYSRLAEEQMDPDEASAYIVESPSDQDYLNRIRIQSIEILPERKYVFSLETPCAHLDEHGMYAVFKDDKLVVCGEFDAVAEFQDEAYDHDDED